LGIEDRNTIRTKIISRVQTNGDTGRDLWKLCISLRFLYHIYNPLIARVTHTHSRIIYKYYIARVIFVHTYTHSRERSIVMSPSAMYLICLAVSAECTYLPNYTYCGLLLDSRGAGLALPRAVAPAVDLTPTRPAAAVYLTGFCVIYLSSYIHNK